jgi:sphinganine-1-phosphate aldolase
MCVNDASTPAFPTSRSLTPRLSPLSSTTQYPQGVIDPIETLSNLAQSKGVGLHVDCCLGGFYLPFLRRLPAHAATVPAFDFALPGVTSMSADTHKYGYATKGTSVVLYRSAELRQHQFFVYPRWSGGLYATPSTAGSRPGALSAACWASLMKLGDEGFLRCTALIAATVEKFKAAIAATDGLRMLGQPVGMVVAFVSDDFNIYRLADAMASDGGYGLSQCQHPPCVHICFTMRHVHHIDAIIAAVRKCTAALLAAPHDEAQEGKGAAIYGMAASMPKEGVDAMMSSYLAGVTDNGWEEGAPPPGSSKL